jgi:class 3 adenylate cyclase/tetratricopeptide (TPR) repeat protein
MTACSACGFENAVTKRFCTQCGAALLAACPACGAPIVGSDRFCGECGTPLSDRAAGDEAPTVPADAGPAAERRLISVLFADLVGFTALSESRDPEDVRELLSRYFETCRAVVERYGGTVEKFIGDAVMAIWGAPIANEDDAERAVRTALDLVDAVASLGSDIGAPELRARAGVLTGEAAVNLRAVGQGMVAGDLVNTASRIQSAAEPGGVLVGEATYHAAEGAIAFEDWGELELKGKAEPIRAWRAVRVIAQRRGVGRAAGLEPPFVGRDDELRLVKDLLHGTAREQRARLVSVTGLPGIGKSRLAWEFLKYVDGLAEPFYWHQGRSPAYGDGVTFWALGEMVRMRAGIAESEDATSTRAKLGATIAEFVPSAEERRWIEPRLTHLLGLADAPPGEREELFSAWRTFFERIAEHDPVVMVFEDMQWADPGLIDFVESILEWSRNLPILVLTLARPEFAEHRPTWGVGQRSFSSLHLDPLDAAAMHRLLTGFVPGMPGDVEEQILARAEGVPLYAVETVRMLADRGALTARGDVYEVSGDLGDLAVPDTLHALIASRLDALDPAQRSLVQDAAVLGASFTTEGLSAVTGADPSALEASLRALVRKEMLTLDSDPRSPERGQYGFVQGLIREVAYSTLARADRRSKHLAVAHHFESVGDDEFAGAVAAHYLEAYRATPEGPEADAVAARARDWLSHAGERALSLGSPEQGLAFFEQALAITAEGPERAALLERGGEAASLAASFERAVSLLEEAAAYYERAGDRGAAGIATARAARPLDHVQRYGESVERCEKAYAALGPEGDERARAELAVALTFSLNMWASGSAEQALAWAEIALPLAERLGDVELLGDAIGAKAGVLFDLGRHREGAMLARGVFELAKSAGSTIDQARALLTLSLYVQDEDLRGSMTVALESADLARKAGDRVVETTNLLNAAEVATFLGELDRADEVLAQAQELVGREVRPWADTIGATVKALRGNTDEAVRFLDELAPTFDASEFLQSRTTFLRMRSLVLLAAGNLEEARRNAGDVVAQDPSGINSALALAIQARAALWLRDADGAEEALGGMEAFRGRWTGAAREATRAGVAALRGNVEHAIAGYRRATEEWRAMDVPLDLALCDLDMIALLGSDGPLGESAPEAREILERLGATPFLRRLDSLTPIESSSPA